MSPVAVTDSLANRPEYVVTLARLIGGGRKKAIFAAVYEGKRGTKTVTEIAEKLNLTEKQVLDTGIALVHGQAIGQIAVGGRVAYSKLPAVKAMRDEILKIAGNPAKIEQVVTKRKPDLGRDSLFKAASPIERTRRQVRGKVPEVKLEAKWSISMLLASPIGQNAIDVYIEAREVEAERRKSEKSDLFSLFVHPAATAESLAEVLNKDQADIIHFSGHGGGSSLLMDNDTINDVGGKTVKLDIVARILKTGKKRPKLLVLNACDTLKGAKSLLDAVDIVIAMSEPIPDSAAFGYSRRLYAALFSQVSVINAHEQACAILAIDDPKGSTFPTLIAASGIDPAKIIFS